MWFLFQLIYLQIRNDEQDMVFKTKREKYGAVIEAIANIKRSKAVQY
jgi:preprotein translocase subunit SecA